MNDVPRKTFQLKEASWGDKGTVRAVISTLNVIDHQGDMLLPGAFGEQRVRLSTYNHGSWGSGLDALPVGKGRIYEDGERVIFEGEFFLGTTAGRETYETVKAMGDLQEYSYALPEIESEQRKTPEGLSYRAIKRVRVPEASPVLLGASIGTQTLDIKSAGGKGMRLAEHAEAVLADAAALAERIKQVSTKRAQEGRAISPVTAEKAGALAARLREVVSMLDGIKQSPEVDETQKQLAQEYLRCLHTQAITGGIT